MKTLLIIGAGQYGQLVKEIAVENGYQKIDFLDDNAPSAIGKIEDYKKFSKEYKSFIVAIGNPKVREDLVEKVSDDYELVTLVHPSAVISHSAQIAKGCIVEAHTVVNTDAVIEKSCFINAGAVVNHNSYVNAYCQIDCNAVVATGTTVPKGTKVESATVWCLK